MSEHAPVRYRTVVYDSARWDGFVFRPGDIVISTPPKCGTTWTQRICALLIFQTVELDRPLSDISPWLDMLTKDRDTVVATLNAQTHRRFIKTHTPLDGLPFDPRVTYICVGRDPRDVALSWDNHRANMDVAALFGARETAVGNEDIAELLAEGLPAQAETEIGRFWAWVDNLTAATETGSSLQDVLHHLATFWAARDKPNVILLHYDDLKRDLEGQMRRLAGRLSIDVPEARWPALVEAATFEKMRSTADKMAPNASQAIWQDNRQFFRSGKSGQWRQMLTDEDLRRYEARVKECASVEVAVWAHSDTAGNG